MYKVRKVGLFNFIGQAKINHILYLCGQDMVKKYDLHHWDNSHFKNFIIVVLCELKNSVFLVTENGIPVATFQTKKNGTVLRFQKLATSPEFEGKGIGTYCMSCIEQMAVSENCTKVCMEVYSLSRHALDFYLVNGYKICGETKTLKYTEIKMEKELI